MKVVILAGGYGTRIRDVADNIPKPMIKVGDKPIIWHIMKYYSSFGFVDFVICLGYRGDVIKDYFYHYELHISDFHLNLGDRGSLKIFENHDEKDWNITFAETGLDSMTGSRMKQIKKYIPENESFLLTYGDGLCDVDLNELIGQSTKDGKEKAEKVRWFEERFEFVAKRRAGVNIKHSNF